MRNIYCRFGKNEGLCFCKPSILSKPAVLLHYFLLDSANAAMSLFKITFLVCVCVCLWMAAVDRRLY